MRLASVVPDKFTFPCAIRACCGVLEVLKAHPLVVKLGLELDVYVGSALVNTYFKSVLVEEAQKVFEELPSRDVVLWNAMVNGFAQIGCFDEALVVFRVMGEERVESSRFTVTGVLSIFAMMGDFDNGRAVHGFVLKMGYDSHFEVSNALIDMYGKCKLTEDALDIFEMMIDKDIYSWNSIIAMHEQCGYHDETLKLLYRMLGAGVLPDLVTITIVVPAWSHLAALMYGREIHGYMIKNEIGKDVNKEDVNDVLMTNAIMDMHTKCGSTRNAYMVFD
ncbi:pentatricopeptide repeat-containing protein At3g14730 [Rosa chinensis]|uniref:pentatricopeptide repeat-containing protein At3g14730 n=1 Tax=Rosa chinensis TaxID=74649 RepID=UPI000D08A54B|nr:pentatricopeptide repeat-containing protein At3g14730 [Rosa chinensis]